MAFHKLLPFSSKGPGFEAVPGRIRHGVRSVPARLALGCRWKKMHPDILNEVGRMCMKLLPSLVADTCQAQVARVD